MAWGAHFSSLFSPRVLVRAYHAKVNLFEGHKVLKETETPLKPSGGARLYSVLLKKVELFLCACNSCFLLFLKNEGGRFVTDEMEWGGLVGWRGWCSAWLSSRCLFVGLAPPCTTVLHRLLGCFSFLLPLKKKK
eukprot:RCo020929